MKIKVENTSELEISTDVLILPVLEGEDISQYADVDENIGGIIAKLVESKEFTGKHKQTAIIHTNGIAPKRIMLAGLGKASEISHEKIRSLGGKVFKQIRTMYCLDAAISNRLFNTIEKDIKGDYPPAFYFIEGGLLGLYRFTKYKTEKIDTNEIDSITVLNEQDDLPLNWLQKTIAAVYYARDMVNTPPKDMTPTVITEYAKALYPKVVKVQVLEKEAVENENMGAYLSVSRGSDQPLKFIVIEYNAGTGSPIALVGKSITFDSGGLSIKPANSMEDMKYDMSGGAAVLGTLKALIELALPLNIVAVLPATENLINGYASKPGDVVSAITGKTIEILNTDAEGRLTLADGIGYAIKYYKPRAIIDIATLTGACSVALGHEAVAIMGTDRELIDRFKKAGNETYERVWEMPLFDEYKEYIKSDVADLKNVGGRAGGVVTAGYFLKEFTGNTPWVHLDIASTAWKDKEKDYLPKGGTGIGVRLLLNVLKEFV
ncbi:MAG: leucyl aminopeptidase [Candidatus Magnetoovum sp. WYHC-5]|nr:leucyl aminopeptidase [Candidatus Magnetoovum sp. WYHC-5]